MAVVGPGPAVSEIHAVEVIVVSVLLAVPTGLPAAHVVDDDVQCFVVGEQAAFVDRGFGKVAERGEARASNAPDCVGRCCRAVLRDRELTLVDLVPQWLGDRMQLRAHVLPRRFEHGRRVVGVAAIGETQAILPVANRASIVGPELLVEQVDLRLEEVRTGNLLAGDRVGSAPGRGRLP